MSEKTTFNRANYLNPKNVRDLMAALDASVVFYRNTLLILKEDEVVDWRSISLEDQFSPSYTPHCGAMGHGSDKGKVLTEAELTEMPQSTPVAVLSTIEADVKELYIKTMHGVSVEVFDDVIVEFAHSNNPVEIGDYVCPIAMLPQLAALKQKRIESLKRSTPAYDRERNEIGRVVDISDRNYHNDEIRLATLMRFAGERGINIPTNLLSKISEEEYLLLLNAML